MRNIGISVKEVDVKPGDRKDPFTSPLALRGQRLVGTVISAKAQRTATVIIERQVKVKKYNRYVRKRSKIQVHNPDSINAADGDIVRLAATKPLSKTKHHVIVEIIKKYGEEDTAETGGLSIDVKRFQEAQEGQRKMTKKKAEPVAERKESSTKESAESLQGDAPKKSAKKKAGKASSQDADASDDASDADDASTKS